MGTPVGVDSASVDVLHAREGYNRWAAIYDDEDNPLIALEEPELQQLIGDVNGLEVADIGCGTGRHTLALAARGARVTGVDFSERMLARARAKLSAAADEAAVPHQAARRDGSDGRSAAGAESEAQKAPRSIFERVRLIQHDITKPLPFPDRSFERVVSGLVVEHIPNLATLMREMGRICRPDGFIVISTMHPAMMLRGISARFTDPDTGRETRPQSLPHTVSDYVMAAVRAGLRIETMSEHAIDEAMAARSPRAAKYLHWPMLLVMRLARH